jgi:two-component system nitrate/nitrite response regulator NarL
MRLVVCDDHALLLESMEIALAGHGHEVVALARDPEEAVHAVVLHDPDICLLDVNFPGGTSVSTVARMREVAPRTKVVMLSGDSAPELVARAVEAGAAGFVRKGESIARLVEELELALEGHLAVEPGLLQRALRSKDRREDPLWAVSYLTDREWQVLRCIVDGHTTAQIANLLGVRGSTARTHVQNVLTKLGVHSRLQAAALVAAHGSAEMWPAHVRREA